MRCRALLLSCLFGISCICGGAFAADQQLNETLVELVQHKHDFRAAWHSLFHGEYSPPTWVLNLDAESPPAMETTINGKDYVFGSMSKASDPAADRIIVLFNSEHKKAWAVEITVPSAYGADAVQHPKKYALTRFFGAPDPAMRKTLMSQMDRDPSWK
jgi:hypothetical protein